MTDVKLEFRERFQHPNIVVSMPSQLEFGIEPMLSYFEEQIRQGIVFKAGETVQMGWMILTLRADKNGDLEVWEPRFGAVPIEWERGASKTYRQLIVQKSVAEQLCIEPSFPSLRQSGVISPNFMASKNFQMFRDTPTGTDSGWLFTTKENVSGDGRLASLFAIASNRPEIIPFLALPADSSVFLNDGRVLVNHAGKEVDSNSNEFLRRLAESDLIS